jgi:hypothetical protein
MTIVNYKLRPGIEEIYEKIKDLEWVFLIFL